jgi:hypothetical protein
MIRDILRYSLLLVLVLLIQLLLFSRLNLGYMFKPQPYIWFIFILPFSVNRYTLLFTAFGTGLIVDALSNTYGLHAASCTLLALGRTLVDAKLNTETAQREDTLRPGSRLLGFAGYFLYISGLSFAHHFLYFFYEAFRFSMVPHVFTTALFSTLGTVASIILLEFTLFRREAL